MTRASEALINYLDVVKEIRGPINAKLEAEILPKLRAENLIEDDLKKKLKEALDENWQKVVSADDNLGKALKLHRKAQWRLDFVAAENSMGFHAPQEAAKILGEATDYFRQAELAAKTSLLTNLKSGKTKGLF